MLEIQANAEDDAFGDFEFASFSPVPSRSNTIAAEDDEWGDFVENPLKSSSLDLFAGVQVAHAADPQPMSASPLQPFGRDMKSESAAEKRWEKPQGAIPLSIFGEEEAEEESDKVDPSVGAHFSPNGFSAKPVSSPKNGAVPAPSIGAGLNDFIMNLYGRDEEIKTENGAVDNSVLVDGTDDFDDSDWEFKNASSESRQDSGGSNNNQNVSKSWDVQAKTATKAEATTPTTPAASQATEIAQNGSRIENGLDQSISSVENFWEFKDALSGAGAVDFFSEEKVVTADFFSGEKGIGVVELGTPNAFVDCNLDYGEKFDNQDGLFQRHISVCNDVSVLNSTSGYAFCDLTSNIYSQAEQTSTMSSTQQKPTENKLNSPQIGQNGIGGLDEDGWEFKDAFSEDKVETGNPESKNLDACGSLSTISNLYSQAEQTATMSSTQQQAPENKLNAPQIGQNGNGGLNEDGWEFKDAFSEGKVENGNPESKTLDAHRSFSAISNLYSQSERIAAVSSTQKQPTENKLHSPQIGQNGDVGLDEDGWEFKDAFSEDKVENGNPESKSLDAHRSFSAISNLYSQAEQTSTGNSTKQQINENELSSLGIVPNGNDNGTLNLDGWDFKDAFSEGKVENGNPESKTLDAHRSFSGISNLYSQAEQTLTVNSTKQKTAENELISLVIVPNGNGSGGLDVDGWDFKDAISEGKAENGNPESKTLDAHRSFSAISNLYSQAEQTSTVNSTKQQINENELSSLGLVPNGNDNGSLDLDGWDFKDAFSEGKVENGNPKSKTLDAYRSSSAISNIHSQAEQTSTVNSTKRQLTENEMSSPQIVQNGNDDFNENGLEFRDAFSRGIVENGNPESKTSAGQRNFSAGYPANGFTLPQLVPNLSLVGGNDGTGEGGWEFKEALSKGKDESRNSGYEASSSHKKFFAETTLKDFIGFYCKLKDEARFLVLHHLDDLKNAMEIAALSGEESKVKALDKEIQVAYKKVMVEKSLNGKVHPEEHLPINTRVQDLLRAVQDPSLQMLEIEYQLSDKISLAEKDLSLAVWLLEHATAMLLVVTLASEEEQSIYISSWSKMVLACAKELKHGAMIWKHLVKKNILVEVLSEPQGLQYFLAFGEIYRVAQILRVSVSFYKPWILLKSMDSTKISQLLEDCAASWAGSGWEESLERLPDSADHECRRTVGALYESIKSIHDIEKLSLLSNYSGQDKQFCRLSLLPSSLIQDMKLVCWDGQHYFLKLANLWANRISCDPPQLPSIQLCE